MPGMDVVYSAGTTPPQQSELLLKGILGIAPRQVKKEEYMESEVLASSPVSTTAISLSKTDLLKSFCKVPIDRPVVVETPKKKKSGENSPPRAKSEKKRTQGSGKAQTPQPAPRFAGSAFLSSPHPDSLPMPDFDENFFE